MAVEPPKTASSADSYIGSLISLTSKSEIRYEGILYSINAEESSIGLRNVRSFGTEGRKKDGPQVAPSEKVYEYILFRGSDIKDLQVKSSPAAQPAPSSSSIDNDPAIIQSHYPRPASNPTNLTPAVGAPTVDANAHVPQLEHTGSSFPGALPLYQPTGHLGSWGASPPTGANGNGLAMPMYWPGYYGPPNGLSQLPQQNLLRPPFGLSLPPSLQQPMQYPGFSPAISTGGTNLVASKLPDIPLSLVTSNSSSTAVPSMPLPQSNLPPMASSSLGLDSSSNFIAPKVPNSGPLSTPIIPSISSVGMAAPGSSTIMSGSSTIMSTAGNKVNAVSSSGYPGLTMSQTALPVIISSALSQTDIPTPSLVTPDQLLQTGQVPISSSPSSQVTRKDVEVVQVSPSPSSESKMDVVKEAQPPILPSPPASRAFQKPNGTHFQSRNSYNYRGRERGNGSSHGRGVTRFTEDFDFVAMNEKFKKDEVWGDLGRSNKSHPKDTEGNSALNGGNSSEAEGKEPVEAKPVYNKDDFFDTLSCNNLDHDSQNGRKKFSEQLELDTQTFGEFARHRGGGRGGRGPGRGWNGPRGRGYGRGYGYTGRGRGRGTSNRA